MHVKLLQWNAYKRIKHASSSGIIIIVPGHDVNGIAWNKYVYVNNHRHMRNKGKSHTYTVWKAHKSHRSFCDVLSFKHNAEKSTIAHTSNGGGGGGGGGFALLLVALSDSTQLYVYPCGHLVFAFARCYHTQMNTIWLRHVDNYIKAWIYFYYDYCDYYSCVDICEGTHEFGIYIVYIVDDVRVLFAKCSNNARQLPARGSFILRGISKYFVVASCPDRFCKHEKKTRNEIIKQQQQQYGVAYFGAERNRLENIEYAANL